MSGRDRRETGEAQVNALRKVLTAEKEAAARIERARAEAERIVGGAKAAARGEAERTDRRIQALHACMKKGLKLARTEIEAEYQSTIVAGSEELDDSEIDRLVERLARRLTGQQG
ncbi:hypothetical protein [Marimonas lutisalis]|uniref:hypothetical protein n=1 Tax=Marimonas lutisalis TaxID=2545756 RepID=UPI0010F49A07|nr:hypothetical protein [Marimonas lutisalis]